MAFKLNAVAKFLPTILDLLLLASWLTVAFVYSVSL